MRSPVIAFTLFAAAAVSPSLIAAAPTSPNPGSSVRNSPRQVPPLSGLSTTQMKHLSDDGPLPLPNLPADIDNKNSGDSGNQNKGGQTPDGRRAAEQQLHNPASASLDDYYSGHDKRASDEYSAGGNSYTGAAGDTSGGSAASASHGAGFNGEDGEGDGEPGVDNVGNVAGGNGGDGFSGFSYGGDGDGKGAGGNSYSGAVGPSEGGDVVAASEDSQSTENEGTGASIMYCLFHCAY
ncbi:predicted protein [Postia placenta Mad-698-R]|nr:predicted protein [Postia placenta Mad-698-R]